MRSQTRRAPLFRRVFSISKVSTFQKAAERRLSHHQTPEQRHGDVEKGTAQVPGPLEGV